MTSECLSESFAAVRQMASTGLKNRLQFDCSLDRARQRHVGRNSQPLTDRAAVEADNACALRNPRWWIVSGKSPVVWPGSAVAVSAGRRDQNL
jgi:hypothetical protein